MSTAAQPTKQSSGGYDVARPLGKCAVSGADIVAGQKFMAALRETPAGFERVDVSVEAWPQFDRANVLAFWQTTMPKHEQKKKVFVRLADTTEPAKINFRFVLGLILMRKRMIIYENTRHEEGKEIWSVRFKGREDKLDLLNPRLDEQQVLEV